jgi:hypothetical protein
MIFYGKKGTLCLYYKGLLISSFPLTNKKNYEAYQYQGDHLIKQSKGIPILMQIKTYLHFCNMIYNRKKRKEPIRRSDHIYFLSCLFALLRLKIINDDELNGTMIFNRSTR